MTFQNPSSMGTEATRLSISWVEREVAALRQRGQRGGRAVVEQQLEAPRASFHQDLLAGGVELALAREPLERRAVALPPRRRRAPRRARPLRGARPAELERRWDAPRLCAAQTRWRTCRPPRSRSPPPPGGRRSTRAARATPARRRLPRPRPARVLLHEDVQRRPARGVLDVSAAEARDARQERNVQVSVAGHVSALCKGVPPEASSAPEPRLRYEGTARHTPRRAAIVGRPCREHSNGVVCGPARPGAPKRP